MELKLSKPRIEVIDALRGLAIFSIMLLHNVEHFDLYHFPDYLPDWIKAVDKAVWETLFFLFSGKSYAIFAFLFGFTFYIQMNNQRQKGRDFRLRFAWRLILLLGFGALNTVFYQGDILGIYAVIGFVLIPVATLPNRWVAILAVLMLLQPQSWVNFLLAAADPGYVAPKTPIYDYFNQAAKLMGEGSFWEVVKSNYTIGKIAVVGWCWEVGRIYQTAGLFLSGMLVGRLKLFEMSDASRKFWKLTLAVAGTSFLLLFFGKDYLVSLTGRDVTKPMLDAILTTYVNLSFMAVLVSAFITGYQLNLFRRVASKLIPIGRMTLTNYVVQSVVGTTLYYGFGFALYRYAGATFSMLIGLVLITLQILFCRWWLKSHKQGPLEYLWHKATWIGSDNARK